MHFQKNAWADTACMIEIAEEFIGYVRKKYSGLGILLFCDNLKAHVVPEVRDVFARGNVFSCYFPPRTTESTQPVDADHSHSMCCNVGNLLDRWLLTETNMAKWEGKMTASEFRVLINYIVAEANDITMRNDNARVGWFLRTGCLLEFTKSSNDDKIKPQGVKSKIVIPETNIHAATDSSELFSPTEGQSPDEIIHGNLGDDDTYGNTTEDTSPTDIVVEEDDIYGIAQAAFEDAGVVASDDEIDFDG